MRAGCEFRASEAFLCRRAHPVFIEAAAAAEGTSKVMSDRNVEVLTTETFFQTMGTKTVKYGLNFERHVWKDPKRGKCATVADVTCLILTVAVPLFH